VFGLKKSWDYVSLLGKCKKGIEMKFSTSFFFSMVFSATKQKGIVLWVLVRFYASMVLKLLDLVNG
jgi:hypothetical protein